MIKKFNLLLLLVVVVVLQTAKAQQRPNVVVIYVDDLGYGDLSCYGATKLHTPNIDKLAADGIRFTHAHAAASTCTPSRYAMMTGLYAWRKAGTGILPGDAALIIPTMHQTLPKVFQQAGYHTGIVGKWHLGLGETTQKNWNGEVKPGPNEVGFDYSFIFPATADRVPTVFLENHRVVNAEDKDPIAVDYAKKIGNEPTGRENPELLKLKAAPGQGHLETIVNGIARIGYMSGGKKARWTDEELGFTFLEKAKEFIRQNKDQRFFLYYALTEPHAPRMPATMFKGKSGLGLRGDAILQLDWAVGEIRNEISRLGLSKETLIIFTSDNGPVLNDGYQDGAVEMLNGHTPAGPLRGGKYSIFEAGTRVPWLVCWPGKIRPAQSEAMVCQIDLKQSLAAMLGMQTTGGGDGMNVWNALKGKDQTGRGYLVEQGAGTLAIVQGNWKYIQPAEGPALFETVNIETGLSAQPQLYNLSTDLQEKENVAGKYPEKVKELSTLLEKVKAEGKL